jgi:mRNA-degrading endonuclease YafQ of YafQ-DinJ toxin-antitoxin module
MKKQLSPGILEKLKKVNVRIQKSFFERVALFEKNPFAPVLNNHELHDEYEGLRSIDITNDYRAVYEDVPSGEETIAYFLFLGTHTELYEQHS